MNDSCINCGEEFEPDCYVVHCNDCGFKVFWQRTDETELNNAEKVKVE